jgi:hypothetical protein
VRWDGRNSRQYSATIRVKSSSADTISDASPDKRLHEKIICVRAHPSRVGIPTLRASSEGNSQAPDQMIRMPSSVALQPLLHAIILNRHSAIRIPARHADRLDNFYLRHCDRPGIQSRLRRRRGSVRRVINIGPGRIEPHRGRDMRTATRATEPVRRSPANGVATTRAIADPGD